jgi:hypothetical protein
MSQASLARGLPVLSRLSTLPDQNAKKEWPVYYSEIIVESKTKDD